MRCILGWVMVSNILYFHPEPLGRWTQFDEHNFQMGWFNQQLVTRWCLILLWYPFWAIFHDFFTIGLVVDILHHSGNLNQRLLTTHRTGADTFVSNLYLTRLWMIRDSFLIVGRRFRGGLPDGVCYRLVRCLVSWKYMLMIIGVGFEGHQTHPGYSEQWKKGLVPSVFC